MARVRQYYDGGGSRRPAELAPGELVWANIINGLENKTATGKARPVILIEPRGAAWKTMGLTTNPRYRDGSPRVAITNPGDVGLKAPGWLWGDRLCWTARIDIQDHIGWIDEALAFDVIELAGIGGTTAQVLLTAAHEHCDRPFPPDIPLAQAGQE
ncbi:MAG: hypothetical protein WD400_01880 [Pontimonas sp.]